MDDFKDMLLSITEKYDKEKRKPLTSALKVESRFKEKEISELTKEEEEKKFFQEMIAIFVPKMKMSQVRIDNRLFLDVKDNDFLIRKPFNALTWAIYKDTKFIFRVTMLKKDKYKFKIPKSVIDKIKFSEPNYEIIRKKMVVEDYVVFTLDYFEALELLPEFRTINKNKQNDLLD